MKKEIEWIPLVLLYAAMVYVIASTTLYDDLGFDFSGYALRYSFAFDSWIPSLFMGMPAGLFDQFLPSILPLVLRGLGFGVFTLPLGISLLLMKMLLPFAFIVLGKSFGLSKKLSFLLGTVLVFNPILFKFFNRYYELTAWIFFLLALAFFYGFLEENSGKWKEFFKSKNFLLAGIFTALTALSHSAPLFFLVFAFLFLVKGKQDLKKFAVVGVLGVSLSAFWILPFFYYLGFSGVAEQSGALLQTQGIFYSTFFLSLILAGIAGIFWIKKIETRMKQFLLLSFALSLIAMLLFAFPELTIFSKPFLHSYHVFFLIGILLGIGILWKHKLLDKRVVAGIAVIGIVALLVTFPIVERQYFFQEPRLSDLPYNKFNSSSVESFEEAKNLMEKIPKDERFELMPFEAPIASYGVEFLELKELSGWGYNVFALKESKSFAEEMLLMDLSCEKFNEGIRKSDTEYWVALDEEAFDHLKECGLETEETEFPALFVFPEKVEFVEGGILLERTNTNMKIEKLEKRVLVKESFFPKWNAYLNGKKVEVKEAMPEMIVESAENGILELKYERSAIEWIGIIISAIAWIGVAVCVRKFL